MIKISNRHKYTILRLKKLFLTMPFTLISYLIPKKEIIIITAAHNLYYEDNARALFELMYHDKEIKNRVYFVLNDREKREKLNNQYPERFISNRSFKNIKIILSAKYWFSSSLELPLAVLFNRYVRKVYHLGHGIPFKKSGLAESQTSILKKIYYWLIFTNITHVNCASSLFVEELMKTYKIKRERIFLIPQPKTATIARPQEINLPQFRELKNKHILYAPTWRPYGEVSLFPFQDIDFKKLNNELVRLNIFIWIRLHPRFFSEASEEMRKCSNILEFSSNNFSDINYYLKNFDVLITDYSSIYCEFLNLNRPAWFIDYDFNKFQETVGLINEYQQLKTISITSQSQLVKMLGLLNEGRFNTDDIIRNNSTVNDLASLDDINNIIKSQLFNKFDFYSKSKNNA